MKKFAALLVILLALCGCAWGAELRPGEEEFKRAGALHNEEKYAEAFAEFQKGAEKGYSSCFTWVGVYYLDGISVDKDIEKGVEFVKKGADLGSPKGLADIGAIYAFGFWGSEAYRNIPLGIEYLEKAIAIDNPNAEAFNFMGIAYEDGVGKEKDVGKALEMYEKADSMGSPYAKESIDRIKNPTIPAQALMAEAEQNQMRFDRDYKDKTIIVSGYVGEIREGDGGYVLEVFGETGIVNPFHYIECRCTNTQEEALLNLNKGDAVKVMGTYRGKQQFEIGSLTLFSCEVVR